MARISILFLSFFLIFSCTTNEASQYERLSGSAFGTTYNIRMQFEGNRVVQSQIDSLIQTVNKSLSTYDPNSLISRINRGDNDVIIDPYFQEVFEKSGKIHSDSDGAFDPTIGIMVNAWGFGPKEAIDNMDQTKVDSLMASVGFDRLKIVDGKLVKSHPNTFLDFNANAKGFGVDVICRFLESKGIRNYLVEIGGEIRALGKNDKGLTWKIAIEEPNFDGTRSFQTIIDLENEVIATSGNYRKFKIDSVSGEKYAHTIDTRTGYPSRTDLLSASVIGNMDCADADGYATAFMAMGFKKTQAFLKSNPGIKGFLIYSDQEGQIKTFKTENLQLIKD